MGAPLHTFPDVRPVLVCIAAFFFLFCDGLHENTWANPEHSSNGWKGLVHVTFTNIGEGYVPNYVYQMNLTMYFERYVRDFNQSDIDLVGGEITMLYDMEADVSVNLRDNTLRPYYLQSVFMSINMTDSFCSISLPMESVYDDHDNTNWPSVPYIRHFDRGHNA
eukprot:gene30523-38159_t